MVSPSPNAIAGWMTNANPSLPHAAVAQGPPGLVQAPNTGKLKVIELNDRLSSVAVFDPF